MLDLHLNSLNFIIAKKAFERGFSMFTDARSKKVIFVSHCILNQNSISDGTALYPGSVKDIVQLIIDSQIGIIQMPCPELLCLGLDRGNIEGINSHVVEENTRIRACMSNNSTSLKIDELVKHVICQIIEYKKHKFQILGIIGINRSPSCGVKTTSDNNEEIKGKGLFISALTKAFEEYQLSIKTIGIKPSDLNKTINEVKKLIALV
jgi:predicted secreted protein